MKTFEGFLHEDEEVIQKQLPNLVGQIRAGISPKLTGAMKQALKSGGMALTPDNKISAHTQMPGRGNIPDDLRGPDIQPQLTKSGQLKKSERNLQQRQGAPLDKDKLTRDIERVDGLNPQMPGISPALIQAMSDNEKSFDQYQDERLPFLGTQSEYYKSKAGESGDSAKEVKESASLYAMMQMIRNGKEINEEDLQYYIDQYQNRYGKLDKGSETTKATDLIGSVREQVKALKEYLESHGYDAEVLKNFKFARVGGTDNDIMSDMLIEGDPMNQFGNDLREFLGNEGMSEIFESDNINSWNPSDVYMMNDETRDQFTEGYKKIMEQYKDDPSNRQNAVNAIAALMRGFVKNKGMLPISLKDTAGAKANVEETNFDELSDEGMEAMAMSMLGPVGLHMALNNTKGTGKNEVIGTDFSSNGMEVPVAMKVLGHFLEDGKLTDKEKYIFAQYYLLGQTKSGANWQQFKNEPKPLRDSDSEKGYSGTAEKFGTMPAQFLARTITELGQGLDEDTPGHIPADADGSYMMGVKPQTYQEPGEYTGPVHKAPKAFSAKDPGKFDKPKPKQGPRQSDASYAAAVSRWEKQKDNHEAKVEKYKASKAEYEKKKALAGKPKEDSPKYSQYRTELERVGQVIPNQYDWDDIGEDQAQFWGPMLDEISEYNNSQEEQDPFKRFDVDLSSAEIGGQAYGPEAGEGHSYTDFIRHMGEIDRAYADPENPDMEILQKYYGDNADPTDREIRQKIRLFLNRLRVAHGMGRLHKSGGLQKYMFDALMKAKKTATNRKQAGFPFLKLGVDPQIDPSKFNVEEYTPKKFILFLG